MEGSNCKGAINKIVSLPPPYRLLFGLPDLSSEEKENLAIQVIGLQSVYIYIYIYI